MLFEARGDFPKLVVNLRHDLLKFRDRHRRADASYNILALRVHQEFAVELFHAGGGITREADARAAGLAQVAEYHSLDVDCGSEHVVNVIDAAIVLGTLVLPGTKYSIAGHDKLLVRILRKLALGMLLDDLLVLLDDFLQRLGIKIGVELSLLLFFLGVENFIKGRFRNFENNVAEHLNESAIRIGRKARVVAAPG